MLEKGVGISVQPVILPLLAVPLFSGCAHSNFKSVHEYYIVSKLIFIKLPLVTPPSKVCAHNGMNSWHRSFALSAFKMFSMY